MIKIEGKVIYQGDDHDVVCNNINHYSYNEVFGYRLLSGCFCKNSEYINEGFKWSMLKTPIGYDGIVIDLESDMDYNWFQKYGWE